MSEYVNILIVEENIEKSKERFNLFLDFLDTKIEKVKEVSKYNQTGEIYTSRYKFTFITHGTLFIGSKVQDVMYFLPKDDYYYDCILPILKVI